MNNLFSRILFGFFILAGFLSISNVFAADADIDTGFDAGIMNGFSSFVNSIASQSDGKTIVGGNFTTYQGVAANYIIRLNSDGSRDSSFNIGNGFNNNVYSVIIQSDGKILVGGNFTTYQGVAANKIIRLNSDGSRDSSFNPGDGFDNGLSKMVLQSDGKIVVVGGFYSYKGVAANKIIRLNSDGSRDSSFNIGDGFSMVPQTVMIQSDGKILVGGWFGSYQGVAANYIIRLNTDGSRDSSFNIGSGFNNAVQSIMIQSDGKILVGGNFTTYQGVAANYIIRLNTDGSRDSSFNIGTAFNSIVTAFTILSDGKILVGGNFTTYQGVSSNYFIKLNTDGSKDTSFNIGTAFNGYMYSFILQSDGKILVGGTFTTYQGVLSNYFIRLNSDGSRDTSFNIGSGINSTVQTVEPQSDKKIIVGGFFTTYKGIAANYIIRLNSDGSRDSSFNIGNGFNNAPRKIKIQNDSKILIGGDFITYQGVSANRIIRLNSDGSRDSSFNIGSGFSAFVSSIIQQNDGKIVIGGAFTTYQGVAANKIIRLNSDGSRDSSFNIESGFNNIVYDLAIQSDGKIIVGGTFTNYQGVGANYIIRLNSDGSRDSSFSIGAGFDATVSSLVIQSDGKILVGGGFNAYQGVAGNYLIRLNSNGSRDTSFNIGNGWNGMINTLAIQTDGKIIVGGDFNTCQGVSQKYLIRLNSDGTKDSSFNIGSGFGAAVRTLAIQDGGEIVVGGPFGSYNGVAAGYLIRLKGTKDVTPPIPTITYSTTARTNEDVVATVTFNEPTTITNNNGSGVYIFTGNGSFTFEFQDLAGNIGSGAATVSWIDKTSPVGTISYSTTRKTDKGVLATLKVNEPYIMINNSGDNTYKLNENGDFTFYFKDLAGNMAFSTASVSWIDTIGAELLETINNNPSQLSGYWRKPWWVNNFGDKCPSCIPR